MVRSIMWVPFPRSIDPMQLDYFVANTAPSFVLRSDVTIIGLPPSAAAQVFDSPHILDVVARRIEGAPLLVAHHESGSPAITHVRGPRVPALETESALERIRQHDIAEVIRRPGAELPKHPSLHYQGPNGDHYEAFLRPGFAARSIEELDRLAFWLAPMLLHCTSILVDHWSMVATAYHIGRYTKELGATGLIDVDSLRAYDENPDVLRSRLKAVFGNVTATGGAILISVNSSGRLVRDVLLPAMAEVGFTDPTAVALAKTPNPPDHQLPALTMLSDDFARWPHADCPACKRGDSTLLPIQNDSYLLNLAAFVQPTAITRKAAELSTDVVQRYRDIGAFRVHTTHSDGRHHAYFIDLIPILETPAFHNRLAEALGPWRSVDFDLIVHPDHPAATRLASMVSAELGVRAMIGSDERQLGDLAPQQRAELIHARRICLVDDVVITGGRVYGYRRALDVTRRRGGTPNYELYCLVGIARTRTEKALMAVADMVHHTSASPHFLSVERLFLPNWAKADCRWCAELRLLNHLSPEIQNRPLVKSRLEALRRLEGPTEELFLPWAGTDSLATSAQRHSWPTSDDLYADRFWELGPKSVFGEVQGADLALSVAAAIQRLRGARAQAGSWRESDLDEVFRSPLAKVLDPQLYLAGRYYEPVLVASILRAARPHDIRAPGDDANLQERIAMLANAGASNELHGELMLASAVHQLPRPEHELPPAHPDMLALAQALWNQD